MDLREYNFDGLVGPTHNYGGLSRGNVASSAHGGMTSHPREAALQGLEKMKFVAGLGVGQAILPPQPRPSLTTLRQLGFQGTDEEVLAKAATQNDQLLRLCSSAAAMWTANAATIAPSTDTADGRLHLTPANLQAMFHRTIEAGTTHAVLSAIFQNPRHFQVHAPLPGGGQFADEGAANHTRLVTAAGKGLHVFAWGRAVYRPASAPVKYPARQTLEASEALARLHQLSAEACVFPQQSPEGIDVGAFHTDVLAVGTRNVLLLHEKAFVDPQGLLRTLGEKVGPSFRFVMATEKELPAAKAVAAYPFNSQLLELPDGSLEIVAPIECREHPEAKGFLDRIVAEENPVKRVHFLDVRQSMNNGGGPACLRLRVPLTEDERKHITANVFYSPALHEQLKTWIVRHYRENLTARDLSDPLLAREGMVALDELTQLLKLGSVYDFQRA
jgi:succinylarginine dihydrolase